MVEAAALWIRGGELLQPLRILFSEQSCIHILQLTHLMQFFVAPDLFLLLLLLMILNSLNIDSVQPPLLTQPLFLIHLLYVPLTS